MKRLFKSLFVFIALSFITILYASCTTDTTGYQYELTSSHWSAEEKGSSHMYLYFDDENAYLTAKSGNDEINIIGKYLADNESFVVFNTSYPENFKFYYELNGENLSLTYGDGTIVLKRQK